MREREERGGRRREARNESAEEMNKLQTFQQALTQRGAFVSMSENLQTSEDAGQGRLRARPEESPERPQNGTKEKRGGGQNGKCSEGNNREESVQLVCCISLFVWP